VVRVEGAFVLAVLIAGCGSESGDSEQASGGSSGTGTGGQGGAGGSAGNAGVGGSAGTGAFGGSASGGSAGGGPGGAGQVGAGGAGADGAGGTSPFPAPVPTGCVSDVTSGQHSFDCESIRYEVSVPDACLSRACGLVVDVHGGTMSAEMENNNTNLRALGAQHGYVVIQPSAASGVWTAATDDPKIFAFMQQTAQAFHLDPKRLHITGFSQGGYMSWRFICQHSDWLASAAPAAAAGQPLISIETPCEFNGPAGPVHEIPILYMHGTLDGLVAFQNGLAQKDAVIKRYAVGNEQIVSQSAAHRWTRYTNASGALFEFIQHDYTTDAAVGVPPFGVAIKGHCYPGSTDFVATEPGQLMAFGCKTPSPSAFTWGEVVIQFFIDHPKP
jgi:polyhydroxybutyrate depolymerase